MKIFVKPIKFLLGILPKSYRFRAILISILLLFNSGLELVGLGAIIPVFSILLEDDVIAKYEWANYIYSALNLTSENQLIIIVSLILLVVIFIKNVTGLLIAYVQSKFAFTLYEFFSIKLNGIYYRRGFSFFKNNNAHTLMRNVNGACLQFAQKQVLGFLTLLNECFILIIIFIGIGLFNPKIFGLLLVTVLPTFALFYFWVRKKSIQIGEIQKRVTPLLSKSLFQSIYGFVDIILAKKEDYFRNELKGHVNEFSKTQIKSSVLNLAPTRVIETSLMMAFVMIIIFGLKFSMTKLDLIKLLGVFAIAGYRVMPSINRIMIAINGLNQTFWIHDVLEPIKTETQELPAQKDISFDKSISLESITCKFQDNPKPLFENYNLKINKGESIGLVGASGSGKTTLMNMLLGFIPPQEGEFKIDDTVFNQEFSNSYYSKVGYVQQQVYLIDGTLEENIALGIPSSEVDLDLLNSAMEKASLKDFISDLPLGIKTQVGEAGTKLSGGQRQRVGIARALYRKVEILFFDEATSALDEQTEKEISDSIATLSDTDLTVIIIAHRLTTLQSCDRIINIEEK